MTDPISIVIGTAALTEGVKFLYGQAGQILTRWRERKDAVAKKAAKTEPAEVRLPGVFEGQLLAPEIHFENLETLEQPLIKWRGQLSNYADSTLAVKDTDQNLLQATDELRRILEAIYRQRITFKGEQREPSGTRIDTEIELGDVLGNATLADIGEISGGQVHTKGKVGTIGPDATFVGTKVGKANK